MDPPHNNDGDNDDHNTTTNDSRPNLIQGILDSDGAELAWLLRACCQLITKHHPGTERYIAKAYQELANLVEQLHRGQVDWIDLDRPALAEQQPAIRNPDADKLRALVLATARATLLQALAQCVSVQRRAVTGWNGRYAPIPETDIEALFAYVRDHSNLNLAGVVETLDAGEHWRQLVLPDIRQHYVELTAQGDTHPQEPHQHRPAADLYVEQTVPDPGSSGPSRMDFLKHLPHDP